MKVYGIFRKILHVYMSIFTRMQLLNFRTLLLTEIFELHTVPIIESFKGTVGMYTSPLGDIPRPSKTHELNNV